MITLQQLRYFMITAREKSFSKAAEILFISQPALSKQITNLEQILQFTLFERTTRGIQMTEKGIQLYTRIEPLIQELDMVLVDLSIPKEVRLGLLPSISSYYIPNILHELNLHNFKTSVYNTSAELLEQVQNGFLDAAIVQDVDRYKNLKHLSLFEEPYLVSLSSSHRLAKKDLLDMEDLHEEDMILPQAPCDIRYTLDSVLKEFGVKPIVKMEVPLNESILSYSSNNIGIAIVPEMVTAHITMKNMVYKRIKHEPLKRTIHFFSRSSAVLEQFHQILENAGFPKQVESIG